jgi:ATP-binding cassette subfamily B protein
MTHPQFRKFFSYMTRHPLLLLGSILSALLSVIATLLGPMLIGKAIDFMKDSGQVDFPSILRILSILLLIYLVASLFSWLLTSLTNQIAYRSVNDMRADLFEKLNQLPLKFFDNTPRGDTISRFVNDIDSISDGLLQGISTLITGIFTILGALGFMLYLNPSMTIVVLLSAPLSFLIARFVTRRTQQMFKQQAKSLGTLNGYIEEIIGGQEVVKAFSYEARSAQQFMSLNDSLYKIGVKAQFFSSLTNPSTRLVNNLTYSAVGIFGSILAIHGKISIGEISSFLIYSNLFARPFNEITGVITQIQASFASAQRIFAILDLPEESPDSFGELKVLPTQGKISFDHVDFSYNPHHPLIQNFSLTVKPGSRIAIVGHTGAGKTTLINLLMRYYEIDSGTIAIDGTNIQSISRDSLRRSFGMVPQDTWLFTGTVRENLAYGKPDATENEIIAAAKAVNAHSFIRRLPQGYDTVIDDSSDQFSQGQKQLLTIARVMLVNPPMLILDEATSSVDTRTELIIQKAFTELSAGKTSFIIAHRLSTIRDADLILVLDKGNIVESGTHQKLLEKNGAYAHLYNSQFSPNR